MFVVSKTNIGRFSFIVGVGFLFVSCADPRGFRPKAMPPSVVVKPDQSPTTQKTGTNGLDGQNTGNGQPVNNQGKPPGTPIPKPTGTPTPVPTGTPTPIPSSKGPVGERDLFLTDVAEKLAEMQSPGVATQANIDDIAKNFTPENGKKAGEIFKGITLETPADKMDNNNREVVDIKKIFLVVNGQPKRIKASGIVGSPTGDSKMVRFDATFVDEKGDPTVESNLMISVFGGLCSKGSMCFSTRLASVAVDLFFLDTNQHVIVAFGQQVENIDGKTFATIRSSIQIPRFPTAEQAEIEFNTKPTPTPTPTVTPTPAPTASPAPTPTPSPTATPTPKPTPTPTTTPTPTPTATPTPAPTQSPAGDKGPQFRDSTPPKDDVSVKPPTVPAPTPTLSPAPAPTLTPAPAPSDSAVIPLPRPRPTDIPTPTPTPDSSVTPTTSVTPTPTPTPTADANGSAPQALTLPAIKTIDQQDVVWKSPFETGPNSQPAIKTVDQQDVVWKTPGETGPKWQPAIKTEQDVKWKSPFDSDTPTPTPTN